MHWLKHDFVVSLSRLKKRSCLLRKTSELISLKSFQISTIRFIVHYTNHSFFSTYSCFKFGSNTLCIFCSPEAAKVALTSPHTAWPIRFFPCNDTLIIGQIIPMQLSEEFSYMLTWLKHHNLSSSASLPLFLSSLSLSSSLSFFLSLSLSLSLYPQYVYNWTSFELIMPFCYLLNSSLSLSLSLSLSMVHSTISSFSHIFYFALSNLKTTDTYIIWTPGILNDWLWFVTLTKRKRSLFWPVSSATMRLCILYKI